MPQHELAAERLLHFTPLGKSGTCALPELSREPHPEVYGYGDHDLVDNLINA